MSKAWNDIINTAMIGTDKKTIQKNTLSPELAALAEKIEQDSADKEEQFLKISSLVLNYRQAGTQAFNLPAEKITVCEEESQDYCSAKAAGVLQTVLSEENEALLSLWLQKCGEKKQLVPPVFLPRLLDLAWRNKTQRNAITACIGQRGKWLTQFNPHWQFGREATPTELFSTGKVDERKNALELIRQQDPALALQLLQQCWKTEQANTRADFLSVFHENLSLQDEPWLSEIVSDKSQKVKEKAYDLLKSLKGSQIVEEVWSFTKPLINLKKSSALLGLVSKENFEINLDFEIPKHFKQYGIEDMEANKVYSEKEFTFAQLVGMIPPEYWEEHFGLKGEEILEVLDKKPETKKFISDFARATNTFKNVSWAIPLFYKYNCWCQDLMPLYSFEVREEMALRALEDSGHVRNVEYLRPIKTEEWSLKFSLALVKKTAAEPYSYSKQYYKPIIAHLPVELAQHLESLGPDDEVKKGYWNNIGDELKRLLMIKKQIIESF